MIIIIAIAGLLTVCWLLFNLSTLALPVFAGISTGLFAFHTGAGPLAGVVLGFLAAVVTLTAGQVLFAASRCPALRLIAGLVFAAPAAVAGYSAVHSLTHLAGSSEAWQVVVSIIGAAAIGSAAWARLSTSRPTEPASARRWATVSSQLERGTASEN